MRAFASMTPSAHATAIALGYARNMAPLIRRGVKRRSVLRDDADREAFVTRLAKVLTTPCAAWALLPNHIHRGRAPRDTGTTGAVDRVAMERRDVGHVTAGPNLTCRPWRFGGPGNTPGASRAGV